MKYCIAKRLKGQRPIVEVLCREFPEVDEPAGLTGIYQPWFCFKNVVWFSTEAKAKEIIDTCTSYSIVTEKELSETLEQEESWDSKKKRYEEDF